MVKYILKMKQVANGEIFDVPHDARSLSIARLLGDSIGRGAAAVAWFEKVKEKKD